MTEPQTWTMIGVFSALMFGMLTIISTMFVRVVRTEISGLRGELLGEIRGLASKVDNLDRDVQLLMAREFGKDRD